MIMHKEKFYFSDCWILVPNNYTIIQFPRSNCRKQVMYITYIDYILKAIMRNKIIILNILKICRLLKNCATDVGGKLRS